MIGKTLAHYEIIEKLGSGGMGDVYKARDTKLGREVALKVLPEEFSKDAERRKRFQREAQAIAALKHPNIVTIHSVEEVDDVSFITMEFVEGGTLADRIPQGGVTLDQFFEYAIPLADAVSNAHGQGISHRDLKPANIMFDRDGRLKVVDFGLSKLLTATISPDQAPTMVQGSDTAVGQIMGTAAYMSPEQAEGKDIDHRSDIFSLGIVLYEMATGERPFKGDTQISTISSILKDTPKHISEIKRGIPRHVGRIVNHCLEKNPDRRFQSAKDVRNDLEGLKKEIDSGQLSVEMESGPLAGVPPAQAAGTKKRFPVQWIFTAGAVIVAIVAMALWPRDRGGEFDKLEAETIKAAVEKATEAIAALDELDMPDERKMAVVLPFDNLGPPEDAYFAAGMTEEITSRLASVVGLGVISRTSATQYDRTGKTMSQIGEDLGVDYVLEGTVRWAKSANGMGRVRITPRLIRVADDTQIWSSTYDRVIDDIFEVQTDIATQVIEQLGITLSGAEREQIAIVPTKNMEAYRLYIQAKDIDDPDWVEEDRKIVELLERATELDPTFVEAWAELSCHHSGIYASPLDKTDERLSRARGAMQKAEALDPDHHMTHVARGDYNYYGFREYELALAEYLTATQIVPNDATARERVGYIYRRQGKWAECIENLERAFELDPRSANIAVNLGGTYRAIREFESALEFLDRAFVLNPRSFGTRMSKAFTLIAWKGDLDGAREVMTEGDEGDEFWRGLGNSFLDVMDGDYDAAIARIDALDVTNPLARVLKMHVRSVAVCQFKGLEAARESLEQATTAIEEILELSPGNGLLREWLAINLAMRGENAAAVREAKLLVDLQAKDQFVGPGALETLAKVYVIVGRHEEAIDLLKRLLKMNYDDALTPYILKLYPDYKPLHDNPDFQALIPENI